MNKFVKTPDPFPQRSPAQDQPRYWYQQGETLANLGHYEKALDCFRRSLQIAPRDVETLVFEAVVLIHLERYEEALASLEQALVINPKHTEAWIFKGAALNHLGRYSECYAAYERALGQQKPHPLQDYFNRLLENIQTTLHQVNTHSN